MPGAPMSAMKPTAYSERVSLPQSPPFSHLLAVYNNYDFGPAVERMARSAGLDDPLRLRTEASKPLHPLLSGGEYVGSYGENETGSPA